jgi:hypothetical protein
MNTIRSDALVFFGATGDLAYEKISDRLIGTFIRDAHGRRPVYGGIEKFQTDPLSRDDIVFHEYFRGDNGAGLGASHQTGWTGLVATLIELYGRLDATTALGEGKQAAFARGARNTAGRRARSSASMETR